MTVLNPTDRDDRGFTLVEILIVIVVLGVLATIVVVSVRGITDRGERSSCQADRDVMATAVENFFAQQGGTAIPISDPPVENVTGVTAEGTLAARGYITDVSIRHDIEPDGSITVQADSGC